MRLRRLVVVRHGVFKGAVCSQPLVVRVCKHPTPLNLVRWSYWSPAGTNLLEVYRLQLSLIQYKLKSKQMPVRFCERKILYLSGSSFRSYSSSRSSSSLESSSLSSTPTALSFSLSSLSSCSLSSSSSLESSSLSSPSPALSLLLSLSLPSFSYPSLSLESLSSRSLVVSVSASVSSEKSSKQIVSTLVGHGVTKMDTADEPRWGGGLGFSICCRANYSASSSKRD